MAGGTTERLRIEPLDLVHAEGLLAALDDARVGTYIGGPDVTTLDALRERIERVNIGPPAQRNERWCNWAVLADGVVIGRVEATVHDGIAEIAYVFGPAWWGQGYASEAVTWMIDELRALDVAEYWATVAPENDASARLLTRIGFAPTDPPVDVSLMSYDDGDLTFRSSGRSPTVTVGE